MDINDLKVELSKHALPVIVKEGNTVFTVFLKSSVRSLSQWQTVNKIQDLVTFYVGDKYPLIEAMHNDADHFLLILKPQPTQP